MLQSAHGSRVTSSPGAEGDCDLWSGAIGADGYGQNGSKLSTRQCFPTSLDAGSARPFDSGFGVFARIFVCLFGGLSLPNRRGSGLWGKVIGVGVRFDGHGYPLLCRRSGPGRTQGTNSTWTLSRRRRPSARLCAAAIHAVLDRPLRHSRFSPIPRQHLGLVTVHRFETDFGDRAL
jgi:hypothetical protein